MTEVLETSILKVKKIRPKVKFWILLVELKNQKPGSKKLSGFFVILILKGIMTFYFS